ncbi:MAG: helix-turn-helix domain-containing protein [Caldilineaceae bacterium SB0666_bin_21]|nr:helix-turn-helix domain-containing protein [Caldilineaceae bacterium SB0666_bin_21]
MIKNERQYRITKNQADRFSRTLTNLGRQPAEDKDVHPLIVKVQEDALQSQLADLEEQLQEYEALKAGHFDLDALNAVTELPTVLIKARIAQGLRQKDLAERLGLKEQQIQQYEATDYATASLTRIKEVAHALGMEANTAIQTTGFHQSRIGTT